MRQRGVCVCSERAQQESRKREPRHEATPLGPAARRWGCDEHRRQTEPSQSNSKEMGAHARGERGLGNGGARCLGCVRPTRERRGITATKQTKKPRKQRESEGDLFGSKIVAFSFSCTSHAYVYSFIYSSIYFTGGCCCCLTFLSAGSARDGSRGHGVEDSVDGWPREGKPVPVVLQMVPVHLFCWCWWRDV